MKGKALMFLKLMPALKPFLKALRMANGGRVVKTQTVAKNSPLAV